MATEALKQINPDDIIPNPENPRLIFREAELNQLLESISKVGIRVPLSVFDNGRNYTLIDGERRWRCSRKLNLKTVPVIIYPKPNPLENLLMMFNIHNVKSDWDIMPMAYKLNDIKNLLQKENQDISHKALSGITGVPLATVKRCFELLDLPEKYKEMLLREAEKPKNQQQVTPDLFIEINNSVNTIQHYIPKVFEKISKEEYVDVMVNKYVDNVITNVVNFREIQKIARAERADFDKEEATDAVINLVKNKTYTITQAYKDTVESAYIQRDLITKINSMSEKLSEFGGQHLPADLRENLINLKNQINRLLEQ